MEHLSLEGKWRFSSVFCLPFFLWCLLVLSGFLLEDSCFVSLLVNATDAHLLAQQAKCQLVGELGVHVWKPERNFSASGSLPLARQRNAAPQFRRQTISIDNAPEGARHEKSCGHIGQDTPGVSGCSAHDFASLKYHTKRCHNQLIVKLGARDCFTCFFCFVFCCYCMLLFVLWYILGYAWCIAVIAKPSVCV